MASALEMFGIVREEPNSTNIFTTAIFQTETAGLPQIKEGICIEDCYIIKILKKDEETTLAAICSPRKGDIIAAKVIEVNRGSSDAVLGPIKVLVLHQRTNPASHLFCCVSE